MELNDRIAAFSKLGKFLQNFKHNDLKQIKANNNANDLLVQLCDIITSAKHYNGWFTQENVLFSIHQWASLLTDKKLNSWTANYDINISKPKIIGVIMAGNIPMVGFHDFLSVLLTGHNILVKQSSNDNKIVPLLASVLVDIEPRFKDKITFTEDRFKEFDAIIATGSNNTARYFDYYFSKVPNVIRKNRNSIAILTGNETKNQIETLGEDIFRYYGLGCRSVSKLMIPKGYDFDPFFKGIYKHHTIMDSAKYANNYDYNKAVYLMSNFKLFENGFLMLKEDESLASPIASLFYEYYDSEEELKDKLEKNKEKIQCVVSNELDNEHIKFGQTQSPLLSNYADGIDIIAFLLKIK